MVTYCGPCKIKVGEFKATTFDELFEKTKALNWGDYIPENGEFLLLVNL